MAAVLSVLILLTCIVLILAVLVQNPKGGGLASGFSSGSQVMGVRRTADFLEKATWTLAVLLFVFSITTTGMTGKGKTATDVNSTSLTKDKADQFGSKGKNGGANNFMGGQQGGQVPGGGQVPAGAKPVAPGGGQPPKTVPVGGH
jgi:preprotein translocase subunit SecG